jgi:hypothetical protein
MRLKWLATNCISLLLRLVTPYIISAFLRFIGAMAPEQVRVTLAVLSPEDIEENNKLLNTKAKIK